MLTYFISASESRINISCSNRSIRNSISSFSFCTTSIRRRSSSLCRRSSCSCRPISDDVGNGITLGPFVVLNSLPVRKFERMGAVAEGLVTAPLLVDPTAVPAAKEGRSWIVCTVPTCPRSVLVAAGLCVTVEAMTSFSNCCCSSIAPLSIGLDGNFS